MAETCGSVIYFYYLQFIGYKLLLCQFHLFLVILLAAECNMGTPNTSNSTYSDSGWVLLHVPPRTVECFKFFTYSSSGTKTEECSFSESEKLSCYTPDVNRKYISIKYYLADSCVKTWSFFDVSGTNSDPIFRVCWWFDRTLHCAIYMTPSH
jgi:hypothetical protein